ncbi:MAG: hypothetical protein U5K81_00395 [Trueperaceae bacterium]|nr:hypothetical protein [Trueperaceae bacterium]
MDDSGPEARGDEQAPSPTPPVGEAGAWVARLHATAHRSVFAFAGAGAEALAWLHAVGGSSRTILEAHDHYHPASLTEALGGAPERAAAPEPTRTLARRSLARARALVQSDQRPGPVFGMGLTATLATDRPKRGEHRAHLATADALGTRGLDLHLRKGARERAGEEALVAWAVLHAAAGACGVMGMPPLATFGDEGPEHAYHPTEAYAAFLHDPSAMLAMDRDGVPGPAASFDAMPALVSGSFHPLHEGHLRLADAAKAWTGGEVGFELPLVNADKPEVDASELARRAAQFFGRASVLLTHAPLFADKAERLPGTVFVIGVDTAQRVLDPRFYGGDAERDASLARIRTAGCRFLVAGRATEGAYRTLEDLALPAGSEDLFEALPSFRVDLSSTALRASWMR